MGLFNKMRTLTGSVPKDLLENGLLGRGIIVSIQQTSVSTGVDFDPSHVCVFTVEVALDGVPRYTATCRQAVKDRNDRRRIALSLGEEPPTVTMTSADPNTRSAAQILEYGVPCKAVIVQSQPMGMRNPSGKDMYAFLLTVMAEGRSPFQTQVGNPVPADAVPLVYPGNTVPAKRMPDGADHEIVIDWNAALAEAGVATV